MLELDDVAAEDRTWLEGRMAEEGAEYEDEPCQDNFRLADESDPAQVEAYEDAAREGCCGSADFRFEGSPSGRTYLWGFNYGH